MCTRMEYVVKQCHEGLHVMDHPRCPVTHSVSGARVALMVQCKHDWKCHGGVLDMDRFRRLLMHCVPPCYANSKVTHSASGADFSGPLGVSQNPRLSSETAKKVPVRTVGHPAVPTASCHNVRTGGSKHCMKRHETPLVSLLKCLYHSHNQYMILNDKNPAKKAPIS